MSDRSDAQTPKQPNIVLILVDDMGYSDIGCYGSEITTPNLDRLARGGVRFSQAYNCARCCPSRAALLTGLYPHQAGVGHMVGDYGVPEYQGYLRDDCATIAEALRAGGYRTLMSGKWHVGGKQTPKDRDSWSAGDATHPHPLDRGFDEYYGTLCGAGSYFRPPTLCRGREFVEPEGDGYYLTDAIGTEAAAMIGRAHDDGKPFFLYAAFTAPHWPLHALEEDTARFRGRYTQGWDILRTARHETLKGLGVLDSKWGISKRDETAPFWGDVPLSRRAWEDHKMAVYAAQVFAMDRAVGAILNELETRDIFDDTLVVFVSDNGGCAEFCKEDGHAANYLIPCRDGELPSVGNRPDRTPGDEHTFMSYELPWAHASNSPFRLYKCWTHEGGISTPLIAHWPKGFGPGGVRHETCHFVDIMPTLLDAAGVAYPREIEGRAIQPCEGESILDACRGTEWRRERPVFWEHQGNRAMRRGDLKLVSRFPGKWELYDMAGDRTETDDLTSRYTVETKEMAAAWDEWAARIGVRDWNVPKSEWK